MESVAHIEAVLLDVEKKFGKKLDVTSKIRTPLEQAKAMYPHFESNSDTLRSYAAYKKDMLREIRDAYETGKKNKESKEVITNRMKDVIQLQVNKNQLISNHLSNSARDIRTKEFSPEELKKLMSYLKSINQIFVLDETKTVQPHLHIHLK
jgi:hypothetical protein